MTDTEERRPVPGHEYAEITRTGKVYVDGKLIRVLTDGIGPQVILSGTNGPGPRGRTRYGVIELRDRVARAPLSTDEAISDLVLQWVRPQDVPRSSAEGQKILADLRAIDAQRQRRGIPR